MFSRLSLNYVSVKCVTCMTVSNEKVHFNSKTCFYQTVYNMLYLILSWLMGRRPEFTDPKVVAQGEGREGKLLFNPWLKMKYDISVDDYHLKPRCRSSEIVLLQSSVLTSHMWCHFVCLQLRECAHKVLLHYSSTLWLKTWRNWVMKLHQIIQLLQDWQEHLNSSNNHFQDLFCSFL